MMCSVSKKNVIVAIFVLFITLFAVAPSGFARHHYRTYHTYYVYHHHSTLKGALIGGAGGALIGGLAGHGKGALIGGAAGAGTGYLIQRYRNHHARRHYVYYR